MNKILDRYIISILSLVSMMISSCVDEPIYVGSGAKGEVDITGSISFRSFAPALESRAGGAPGDAIKNINSLWIAIYEKGEEDQWTLEKDGLIQITKEQHNLKIDQTKKNRPDNKDQAEDETGHASFTLRHKSGQYKIYAVANYDLSELDRDSIMTPDLLKLRNLSWDDENIGNNSEMFGCFSNNDVRTGFTDSDETVTISKAHTLHAWVRRAASKVTIAYDGSGLEDDVTIYILSASIKKVPRFCTLGTPYTPNRSSLLQDGGTISYFKEGDFADDGTFTNSSGYVAKVSNKVGNQTYGSDHSETAEALFFYENLQGKGDDKRQKDEDGDGKPDNADKLYDNKPYGTYIEVDAIYDSNNEKRPGYGRIKYRFMLGKDVTTDYDAERNYHYKLTLKFKYFANDPDWHIEFKEQVLDVTQPRLFNYQGKIFEPEYRPDPFYNYGHNFNPKNTVAVTSYIEEDNNNLSVAGWSMQYDDGCTGSYSDAAPAWLKVTSSEGYLPYVKNVTFEVASLNVKEYSIDDELKKADDKGSAGEPYNLANPAETKVTPESATIQNTANCYIVDAPGDYIFPLVYGSSVINGGTNDNAYHYQGTYEGKNVLEYFKDHMGKDITSPYIQDKYKPEAGSAFLLWQDENGLIQYDTWKWRGTDIKYLPDAYGGKGGIQFHIDKANIKQGNAVIALGSEPVSMANDRINLPPSIIWSWHIWVTNFKFLREDDKTIEVTSHSKHKKKFRLLPVNLGWCSGRDGAGVDEKVKYYRGRKCRVKFSAGGGKLERVITIEQKPHIAVTQGNSLYYQWGRKDPFVGTTQNVTNTNKTRYVSINWPADGNPAELCENWLDSTRYTTRAAIDAGKLVSNPHLWHNPRRKENDTIHPDPIHPDFPYLSNNEIYVNLWQGRLDSISGRPTLKTVYDPCPPGYQVPHYTVVTGFTTTGENSIISDTWYDVRLSNIANYDPNAPSGGKYTDHLFEFYTDSTKSQSIIFPESGYRDWDARGGIFKIQVDPSNGQMPIGYMWAAGNKDGTNGGDDNNSYNFEFSRTDQNTDKDGTVWTGYIRPKNYFYPCDGFPIRPCAYDKDAIKN